jgi:inhibitor of cysteine peptidase
MYLILDTSSSQNRAECIRSKATAVATVFVMALAATAIIGCSAKQKVVATPTVPSSPITVTEQDNSKSIELAKGQIIFVRLASNPTTGYQWMQQRDAAPLELVKSDFASDTPAKNMAGVGGTQSLQFVAKSAGKAILNLEYRRPWEKDVAAARTFTLTVVVK